MKLYNMHINVCMHMHICTYIIGTYVCMFVCMYIERYLYVYMNVCMYCFLYNTSNGTIIHSFICFCLFGGSVGWINESMNEQTNEWFEMVMYSSFIFISFSLIYAFLHSTHSWQGWCSWVHSHFNIVFLFFHSIFFLFFFFFVRFTILITFAW